MKRPFNFSAGPSVLPEVVLEQIQKEILDWDNGMSVMEVSHRTPPVEMLFADLENNIRTLLNIPKEFAILFMQGGARGQFSAVPLNLVEEQGTLDYAITGFWSQLAVKEAQNSIQPNIVMDCKDSQYRTILKQSAWKKAGESSQFLHYTDNETIEGIEFVDAPLIEKENYYLISDMTSSILSKALHFDNIGLIYASAQKNLGIAGLTVVIVRKSLFGKARKTLPSILNYEICNEHQSMHNTPPVFAVYVAKLMTDWIIKEGGVSAMQEKASLRSSLLYHFIDNSQIYKNDVDPLYRSKMNVPFYIKEKELEKEFLQQAEKRYLIGLKGHRVKGGLRASIYNAMPLDGVKALIQFMQEFELEFHGSHRSP